MEVTGSHRTMAVTEASQPSAARFIVRELAETAGFSDEDSYRAGLVATELATNLVKHATGGEFLARVVHTGSPGELEMIAIDRGPGIRDVAAALADGHSTAGSPGNGLGAVRRLADTFDIFSVQPRGTAVLARLVADHAPRTTTAITVAAVSVSKPGEQVCGDRWSVRHDADGFTAAMADGLGHGLYASEAASAALAAFEARRYASMRETMQAMHESARHTRGAAAAVADVRRDPAIVTYAGIGNISSSFIDNGRHRQAVSHNGTLGHEVRVIREYTYPWAEDALMVMHSDGLGSHWSLDDYRGLRQRHPALIAAVLYRDHSRGHDDVTVLVGRRLS